MSAEASIAPPGGTMPPPRGRRTTVRRAPSAGARYRSSKRSIDEGYACETAFREDHRRVTPKDRTAKLLFWAMNVGESQYWKGYTVGQNRQFEERVPQRRAVGSSSGPKKRQPGQEMDVRPPQ